MSCNCVSSVKQNISRQNKKLLAHKMSTEDNALDKVQQRVLRRACGPCSLYMLQVMV